MPVIAWYVLKLSVSLFVVYLFYQLVLHRLTFYTWNRWYLLGYSLLAFWIPFININPFLERNEWTQVSLIAFVPVINDIAVVQPVQASAYDTWDIVWGVLITGILIMGLRLLLQYISFRQIRRSAQLITPAPVKVYQINRPIIPFSFGRSVFINRHQHNDDELKKIISHEFIHVKQKHTIDILWAEVLCMLNWYNPFAWLIRKSIRQNLEFITDNNVIETGIDKKEYQYLLLKVVGIPSFSITPQFNIVSLKKRIAMMNKIRSAKIHLFRFLFVLPLAAVMLLAFRNGQHTEMPAPLSVALPDHITGAAQDTVPKVVEEVKKDVVVVKASPYNKKGYHITIADNAGECVVIVKDKKKTIIKAIQLTEWDKNKAHFEDLYGIIPPAPVEKQKPKVIVKADTVLIIGDKEIEIDASLYGPGKPKTNPGIRIRGANADDVLYVVDGRIVGKNAVDAIDPSEIVTVTVLKDKTAMDLYGEKGKNGVIIIDTRDKESPPITVEKGTFEGVVPIYGDEFKGMYVVDGKAYTGTDFKSLNVDPNLIESVIIIKGKQAQAIYGIDAGDGIIFIKLKNEPAPDKKHVQLTPAMQTQLQAYAQAHNIIYIGVDNPIQVAPPGTSQDQFEVEMDKGAVKRTETGFMLRPSNPGEIRVDIFKKDVAGGRQLIRTRQYSAKFLPAPQELAKLFELQ